MLAAIRPSYWTGILRRAASVVAALLHVKSMTAAHARNLKSFKTVEFKVLIGFVGALLLIVMGASGVSLLATLLLAVVFLTTLFIAIRREMTARNRVENYDNTLRDALLMYSNTFKRAKVLHGLLDLLAERHAYTVSAFYAYQEWGGELYLEAGHGLPANFPNNFRLGKCLVGEVAQSGHLQQRSDASDAALNLAAGSEQATPAFQLAVPVTFREHRLGVLLLVSSSPFSEQDCVFLGCMADQLSNALNNRKQFRDLKHLAQKLLERSEEISQKNLQLEEVSRTKSAFLANMSHELRTPLNAIIGFSEALRDGLMGEVAENQREYIDDIYTSGEHLLSLINDILDLAKVESGKMLLKMEAVSLPGVLHNSLSMVKEKALNNRLSLKLEKGVDLPEIIADQRKLKQIVYNLLSNAVKFTPAGGVITLSVQRVDGMLEIAVSDTGIGISVADQALLFQSFTQIDNALSRLYEGTGLGLVLVKHLAELHGGSVGVSSEEGKGSRFWARIPWRVSSSSDDENPPAVFTRTSPVARALVSADACAILIIEDGPSSVEMMSRHLKRNGYQVSAAYSGAAGIVQARTELPDAILLDLLMPEINGFEVLDALKADPFTAHIPVIIVTAKLLTEADYASLNGRVAAILEKAEFHYKTLAAEVLRVLQKGELAQ